jgi:class 3 adenylate cyclase/tetratricopeptide (TPR) repeat protein
VVPPAEAQYVPEGERKTVTAFFADIKDSTELISNLDPEDARAIVDPALDIMVEAVRRYGGYVVQSTGDGIFALFGAPAADEDHPQRALYAALYLQRSLEEYAEKLRARAKPRLQARVGINTGEVVMRMVQTGGRTEYAPVGHVSNLASRLQTVAPAGSTVISEQTRQLVEGYFELRALGPTNLKGINEAINIYEVTGLGPLRTHFQLAARRGLTKFVGREREIADMQRVFEQTRGGRGHIIAVVAEAGAGKSRLLYEFKATLPPECKLLEAYSMSHGQGSAWQPVLDLLRGYFAIQEAEDLANRREKVRAALAALDSTLGDVLPYLLGLLEIREHPDPLAQMDPDIKRRRTLEAIKRIILRESLNRPVVVIFEDLHWIDEETQALIDLLADSIANSRVLLLVNYRPEYRHQWANKSHYSQFRLDALPEQSASEMLSALLGDLAELTPFKKLVIERTEGNPFFIEEMVQALFDQGALVRSGPVNVVRSPAQLRLPPTVQGVLASRIDRLPPREKELLQTLAVVGRAFPLSLISHLVREDSPAGLLQVAPERLEQMLSKLQSAEFIYEHPDTTGIAYSFKHALTQDVAYGSILSERRKLLHERTAETIEALFSDRLNDHVSDLAHHYSRSANAAKAARYLFLAGRQAASRAAHSEALADFGQGLEVLGRLAPDSERGRLELRLQIGSGFSLRATKGFTAPEVERALVRARDLCAEARDDTRLFDVLVGLHTFHMFGSRLETSRELAQQLLSLAEKLEDPTKLATALLALGQTSVYLGEFQSARSHLERALTLGAWRRGIRENALGYLGPALWSLGYAEQSTERIREALGSVERSDRPLLTANVRSYACTLFVKMRIWQETRELAESGISLANQHGFVFHVHLFTLNWGRALLEQGEIGRGIVEMRHSIEALEAMGAARPWVTAYWAEACLKAGKSEEGLQTITRAISIAEETGDRWTFADLLRLKGELLMLEKLAEAAQAEQCFRAAVDVAHAQQARSFELRAITSLARLLFRQCRRDEARTALVRIYDTFTEGFEQADMKDAKALLDELNG